jgi:exopolyphosphatase/pppGpp-phosphohydrolase
MMANLSDFTKELLEKITFFGHYDYSLGLAVLSSVIKYLEKEQKRVDKEIMKEGDLSLEELSEKDRELCTDFCYAIDRLSEHCAQLLRIIKVYKKIKKIEEMDIDEYEELKKLEKSFKDAKDKMLI